MKAGILYILSSFKSGGTESQLLEILKRMDRGRFEPRVVCFSRTGGLLRAMEDLGIEIETLGFDSLLSPRALKAFRRVAAWARARNVRIIHGFHFHGCFYGAILKKMIPGSRLILCEQGLTEASGFRYRLGRAFYYRASDVILANCLAVRDVVASRDRLDPARVRIIHGGVDMEKFRPAKPQAGGRRGEDGVVIGCVGRLHPDKGQLVLAKAAPEILGALPGARIVLAGDGPQRGALEAAIAAGGVSERMILLGDQRDIPALLSTFDLLILPSMNEGFANAALEAMSCGVPVIASDAGGNPEVVRDGQTGRLFRKGDAASLAACVVEMAKDLPRARALAGAARERAVKEFGVDTLVRRHEELYGELIAGGEETAVHEPLGRRA
jgi:glycosyltransferase involved in cell wall biosynthesis